MNTQTDKFLEIYDSIDFHKIKDHPNILIAANFWEADRYCAAKTCYKFMRAIDDMIDNYKAKNKLIEPGERKEFVANVQDWLRMIIVSQECNPMQAELIETVEKFNLNHSLNTLTVHLWHQPQYLSILTGCKSQMARMKIRLSMLNGLQHRVLYSATLFI